MIGHLFENKEKYTPFAPVYSVPFYHRKILIQQECDFLVNTILEKEKQIIQSYPQYTYDGGTGLGPNSLTAKFPAYNLLKWYDNNHVVRKIGVKLYSTMKELLDYLEEDINEIKPWVQCWANVVRKGERLTPHQHSSDGYSFLSANICLQAEDTQTVYQDPYKMGSTPIDNKPGTISIFPEYVIHWTTPNKSDKERVTLGIDIVTEYSLFNAPDRNRDPDHFLRLY